MVQNDKTVWRGHYNPCEPYRNCVMRDKRKFIEREYLLDKCEEYSG